MADSIKKGTERATIDCSMLVFRPYDTSIDPIGITSSVKLGVEAQLETSEAIKLIIKSVLKAQKPERKTITGHKLTITNNLTTMELLPILQGGELLKDEDENIIGYQPIKVGEDYEPTKFILDAYSAVMDGSTVTGYEKVSYPGCTGEMAGLGSEDDVFRSTEWTINSNPGGGEAPYTLEYVDALPVIA